MPPSFSSRTAAFQVENTSAILVGGINKIDLDVLKF